jgi:hypothetical protein
MSSYGMLKQWTQWHWNANCQQRLIKVMIITSDGQGVRNLTSVSATPVRDLIHLDSFVTDILIWPLH